MDIRRVKKAVFNLEDLWITYHVVACDSIQIGIQAEIPNESPLIYIFEY